MDEVINLSTTLSVILQLGRVGENNVNEITFDFSNWQSEFGEGTVSLVCKRPTDAEGYPVSLTVDGTEATWLVSSTDVAYEGIGQAQVTYMVNGVIKKSVIYMTKTCPSIEPVSPTPPDPYASWLDQMIEVKDEAEAARDEAEAAAETLEIDDTLTQQGQAADAKKTGDEIAGIADDIFAEDEISMTTTIATLFDVEKANYNLNPPSSTKCVLAPSATYNSYYFEVAEAQAIYFGDLSALSYIALGIVRNVSSIYTDSAQQIHIQGTSASRLRKSDNNMPTSASPLTLGAGDVCIVTIPNTVNASNVPVYLTKNARSHTVLNNNIVLNENQINQTEKRGYLQYVNGSGNDASVERLNIYMPSYEGYIKYEFLHSVNSNNCNVWRMGRVFYVDKSFAELVQLTTNGEWECAIKLQNRDDFAGGYNHGNEVCVSMAVYIDGKVTDITSITGMISFENVDIIQHSNLYDPDDSTTIFAEHGSNHNFNVKSRNNLEIKQAIKWLGSYITMPSYLAMFPPLKATTDKIYNDVSFTTETITLPQTIPNVQNVTLTKDSLGFSCDFGIEKYPDIDSLSGTFFMSDNSGQEYNKCYFYACGNNASIASGSVWKSKTIYNLTINASVS